MEKELSSALDLQCCAPQLVPAPLCQALGKSEGGKARCDTTLTALSLLSGLESRAGIQLALTAAG